MLFSLQQGERRIPQHIFYISDELSVHGNHDWQFRHVPRVMEAGRQCAGFLPCCQWITVLTCNPFCCSGYWPCLNRLCQACWTVPESDRNKHLVGMGDGLWVLTIIYGFVTLQWGEFIKSHLARKQVLSPTKSKQRLVKIYCLLVWLLYKCTFGLHCWIQMMLPFWSSLERLLH